MKRKAGTRVHQKTLILTRGSMLYCHWMPGVPKSGGRRNNPDKGRYFTDSVLDKRAGAGFFFFGGSCRDTHRSIGSLQAHELNWLWSLQVNGMPQSVPFSQQSAHRGFQPIVDWGEIKKKSSK